MSASSAAPVGVATPATPFARSLADALSAEADAPLAAYYAANGWQPLFTAAEDGARRLALISALDRAPAHGLPAARYDAAALRDRLGAVRTEGDRARAEAAMARAFLAYASDVGSGALVPSRVDKQIVRAVPHRDKGQLIAAFSQSDPAAFLRALPPQMPEYAQLMKAKLDLETAIARGGWGQPVPEGALHPGDTGRAVVALRDRLIAEGYLSRTATGLYDADVTRAVQDFQIDMGLDPDGVAGAGTIAQLNARPETRLRAVVAGLERLRWMNGVELGERHIWVNLPDFTAKIVDDGRVTFRTVAVIGMDQDDRRTPEFSDQMEYMVVNPSWHVPRTITVKEYLPMMQRNRNAAAQLDLVDSRGRVVPRDQVNFAAYTPRNFPFAMRQPPSDGNALGLVKFMFPNKWNIYLHDTPSKSLFQKEVRAFSHGCIRLQQPFDFAYQLLSKQTDDPEGLFQRTLSSGREQSLTLDKPVPVHLVYYTAWPTPRGHMEYRNDIYGRDAEIFRELQEAGLVLASAED
ncbi:L,D-transpeptidase family protein [Frigidibacter sp. MR17.14]|uniref:L,D-transpeptidase family protein n=1 Tax=Frigidibacter sp. MR17.14 TaxID=3126509 RepID=UPI0030130DD5